MFLHWSPHWSITDALQKIVAWHQHALIAEDMRAFTLQQIDEYLEERAVCQHNI
jgi:hypothetical protein